MAKGGSVLIALGTAAAHHAQIPLWGGNAKDAHDYARGGNPATVGQVDFSYPALEQAQPGRDNGGWAEVKVLLCRRGRSRAGARGGAADGRHAAAAG